MNKETFDQSNRDLNSMLFVYIKSTCSAPTKLCYWWCY